MKYLITFLVILWALAAIAGCDSQTYNNELRADAADDRAYAAQQNAIALQAQSEVARAESIAAGHQADADRYAAQQNAEAQRHAAQLAADAQRYAAEQSSIARQAEAAAQRYVAEQSASKWSQLTDAFQSFINVIPFILVLLISGYIILRMMDNHSRLAMAVVENNQQPSNINVMIPPAVERGMRLRGADSAVLSNGSWELYSGDVYIDTMTPTKKRLTA